MRLPFSVPASVRQTLQGFAQDRVATHAAALAFYTALSLPPIVILLMWTVGSVGAEGDLFLQREAAELFGPDAARVVSEVVENADTTRPGASVAGLIGAVTLLLGATGVFAQLQAALNRVWDVKPAPGNGIVSWLKSRLLSAGVLGLIAFLMLVSLAASAAIGALGLADEARWLARAANQLVSIAILSALFAFVFKFLPDAEVRWRRVWSGAFLTALLFTVGRWAISIYVAEKGLGSKYGAAGSIVVLLVWVYFNAILLLLGAEWTRTRSALAGDRVRPNAHAKVDEAQHAADVREAGGERA